MLTFFHTSIIFKDVWIYIIAIHSLSTITMTNIIVLILQ